MAGYKTHLTCSSLAGVLLGGTSTLLGGLSLTTGILMGTLCAVGGILPDIDSKTSQAFKTTLSLVSGLSALLLVSRLRDFPMEAESVVLLGGIVFVSVRFFVGGAIRRFSVHRGMFHSIPSALIFGEIIFLLSSGSLDVRIYKGLAVSLGFLIHLLLDEYYSVDLKGVRLKNSFATALKFANFDNVKATVWTFIILAFTTHLALNEPVWTEKWTKNQEETSLKHSRIMIHQFQKKYPDAFDQIGLDWLLENQLQFFPTSKEKDILERWRHLQQEYLERQKLEQQKLEQQKLEQ